LFKNPLFLFILLRKFTNFQEKKIAAGIQWFEICIGRYPRFCLVITTYVKIRRLGEKVFNMTSIKIFVTQVRTQHRVKSKLLNKQIIKHKVKRSLPRYSYVSLHIFRMKTRVQGRNEVRWRPGKKQVWRPYFRTEFFRKQTYCTEESTCEIVGSFRRPPQWFDTRGIVSPCPPRYAPAKVDFYDKINVVLRPPSDIPQIMRPVIPNKFPNTVLEYTHAHGIIYFAILASWESHGM